MFRTKSSWEHVNDHRRTSSRHAQGDQIVKVAWDWTTSDTQQYGFTKAWNFSNKISTRLICSNEPWGSVP